MSFLNRSTELSLLSRLDRLTEHRKNCDECREMRNIQEVLIKAGTIEVPDDRKEEVLQNLRDGKECYRP